MEYYLRKKGVANRQGYKHKKNRQFHPVSFGRSTQRKVPTAAVARAGWPTAAAAGPSGRARRPLAAARQEGWRRHAGRRAAAARAGRPAGARRKSGGGFVRGRRRRRPGLEGRRRRAWRLVAAWLGRPPAAARDGRQAAAWRWDGEREREKQNSDFF